MKIYIVHSFEDEAIYEKLWNNLIKEKYEILNKNNILSGTTIIERLKNALHKADILIAIITENFLSSPTAQAELGSVVLGKDDIPVLLFVVGDVSIPFFLAERLYIRVKNEKELIPAVLSGLQRFNQRNGEKITNSENEVAKTMENNLEKNLEEKINLLQKALNNNQLTLVCGAGVSEASGMPDWKKLLVNILNGIFSSTKDKVSEESLLSRLPQSNLILGKYFKNILKDNFNKTVQKHLYSQFKQENLESKMMEAIVELSRPNRNGKRLESIITFNFDDLIEKALSNNHIDNVSIWKEGQEHRIDDLPIFHVHGFLPKKELDEDEFKETNLVFSEEAYHSLFIDPYSWSNLIQLNTFYSNVCLFVGLSLEDPNLRRLLDISWRKNQKRKHYIIIKIKKLPQNDKIDKIATTLCEQDANLLGLNVIWCSDYSEIPGILLKIGGKR